MVSEAKRPQDMTPDERIALAVVILKHSPSDRHTHFLDACAIADDVIQFATPIIEAALIERLAVEAAEAGFVDIGYAWIIRTSKGDAYDSVEDWIRGHLPTSDARPDGEGDTP